MNLTTNRLELVPISHKFEKELFENFTSEVTTYMFPPPSKEISETAKFVEISIKGRENKTDYIYVILLKDTKEFIGTVGLHFREYDSPEFGIWTKISSHGNYYGREAIGGMIEFAKGLGCKKVIYPVDKRNISSKKIPIYYGGKVIIPHLEVKTPDGRILQEEVYEIQLK